MENLVQAKEDQQTHLFLKSSNPAATTQFIDHAKHVEDIVEQVLGGISGQATMPQQDPEKYNFLEKLGLADPDLIQKVDELLSLTAFSKTYEYEEMRLKVIRQFLEGLSTIALDKRLGLSLLVDFFRATRAKAGFFTLLLREDRLIRELCLLFGASPYLGSILTSRPELLDSYLFRTMSSAPEDLESYLEHLSEKKMLNEIIAANQFLQSHQLEPLLLSTSTCADEIASSLLLKIAEEQKQDSPLQILALGKWGSRELGLKSDLDFIFVTPDTATEGTQKLARRFLSRLTEAHRGGSIYQTDMRLRPTGKSGPLIVSLDSLIEYLKTRAEPWERQSYLRARLINTASESWTLDIHTSCYTRALTSEDLSGLRNIIKELISQKANDADLKYAAGGLMDVEMAVQIEVLFSQNLCLATDTTGMLDHLSSTNAQWQSAAQKIKNNYLFLRQIEQLHQLVSQHSGALLSAKSENFLRLAKTARLSPEALLEELEYKLQQNNELLKRLDRRQAPE
jgi:glutamate-ammonia-ligase adenylyltransferase